MAQPLWTRVAQRFSVLFAVIVIAGACASTAETTGPAPSIQDDRPATTAPVATPAPTPPVETTVEPTPEPPPTAVPTVAPVPTATAVPPATATPVPTATATPEATVTPEPVPPPLGDALAMSTLTSVACPADVAGNQVTCAVATLPLNPFSPDPSETVTLMTALVDNDDLSTIGPVVFLQGGPGVGSVTNAKRFAGRSHDVLFVDQRGTGYSIPKLDCPEADENWVGQFSNDPAVRLPNAGTARIAAYRQCSQRLANQGVDLNAFNTAAAAADIELLRQLFEYEQWSLWGISYGTRLGLTVMRDYPDGVRAAVLDSIVPFEVDFFATLPENAFRSITALDGSCDDTVCAEAHGDFLENLAEVAQELNQNPAIVQATRPSSGTRFPFRVGGTELIDMVFIQLYSTSSLRALPRQISRADFGGIEELVASYVSRRDPEAIDLAIGLYYATWCREEFPFYDSSVDDAILAELQPAFGTAFSDSLSSDGLEQVCEIFKVSPAGVLEDQPLVSDIPTLVFAGAFDPITPPQWSRQVADQLTSVTYVEMADHGHGMSSVCTATIRFAFLQSPSDTPDISCALTTPGPAFE